MIVIDGKTFYNLEEAVQKNMCDIRALKYGLKIVGQVDNVPSLPGDAEVGDCYLVGKERPYYFYVKIGEPKTYLNLGTLESTVPGPKGDNGLKGDPGVRGSYWKVGTKEPSIIGGENTGDCYLNVFSGLVYYFVEGKWVLYGSLKGPQGPQGDKGEVGPQGPQGPRGPRGEQGEMGSTFIIRGIVESTTDLPTPPAEPTDVYLIDNLGVYEMWVWADMLWTNLGAITNVGPKVVAVPGGELEGFLHEITVGETTYYVGADDFVEQLELKTDHTMLDWGVGPELVETKHDFYTAVGEVFVNKPRQSIYMFGTPAELATFFSIWGKPQGLTATHVFIAIQPLSNKSSRVSFKMYLSSSNTGEVYEMIVSGYNGSYIKDSGWYNTAESIADIYDRLQYHDEDITRIDAMLGGIINDNSLQDKKIKNLTAEVAEINDKINSTIVTPVRETFETNPFDIPKTVKIDGTSYTVLKNQQFKLIKIEGQSQTKDQPVPTILDSSVSTITSSSRNLANWIPSLKGQPLDNVIMGTIDVNRNIMSKIENKIYHISFKGEVKLAGVGKLYIIINYVDGTKYYMSSSSNNYTTTKPISNVALSYDSNCTYDLSKFELQIEEGDTKTAYVPYGTLETSYDFNTILRSAEGVRDELVIEKNDKNLYDAKVIKRVSASTHTPQEPVTLPLASDLTLADIAVLAQTGGSITINQVNPENIEPYSSEFEFNIKYWKEA